MPTTPEFSNDVDQEDIDMLLNECREREDRGGSKYPGMTYEQGVIAAIEWLTFRGQPNPMED